MRRFACLVAILACAVPALGGRGRWTTGGPGPNAYLVVPDPLHPRVVYASIGSPQSLYRSADGGLSWTPIDSPWPFSVAVDPSADDVLYVGGFNIFRSADGGAAWDEIAPDLTASDIQNIVVAPNDSDVLYLETRTLPSGPLGEDTYRFVRARRAAGGAWSWSVPDPDFTTRVTGLIADASSPGTVFASGRGGVYRSADGGDSWNALPTGLPADTEAAGVAIRPGAPSWLYAPVGVTTAPVHGVLVSRDGGGSWTREAGGLPDAPLKCAAVDPRDPSIAYVGSAGSGVYRTLDGGRTWNALDAGLPGVAVFSLAVDAGGRVYAGTDAGVFVIEPTSIDPAETPKPALIRRR